MLFYLAKNRLEFAFNNHDKKEIISTVLQLSREFPDDEANANVFGLFDKFIHNAVIMLNWKNYELKDTKELKEVFEKIWDLVTTNMFFNEIRRYILKEDMQLFEIIKVSILNSKISSLEEMLSEIETIVGSINPEEIEQPKSKYSKIIGKIMLEGIEAE